MPCIDDRRIEHRVLVQGRLGALHKADLEPIICSLMVAKVSYRSVEHRVLVQGRLGALHKADLEPIICSFM